MQATLTPVERVDVTVLVDNSVDLLAAAAPPAHRHPLPPVLVGPGVEHLRAEHGYSLLVRTHSGGRTSSILYDAGLGRDTLLHNLDVLDVDVSDLRAIVLSHGHADHHGGLEGVVARVGRRGMPFVVHPDAWKDRRVVFPTGVEIAMPPPSRHAIEGEGLEIVDERGPSLLLDGSLLVSGQTERVTDFEKGFPWQQEATPDGWQPDPWIWDDQSVVIHVAGKGLVVLSSCSHAGAINVVRHARAVTGVAQLHAFIGGFHLTGGLFEPIISRTVEEFGAFAPDYVVPGHCTGWRAIHELSLRLPDAFVQSLVGTTFTFTTV